MLLVLLPRRMMVVVVGRRCSVGCGERGSLGGQSGGLGLLQFDGSVSRVGGYSDGCWRRLSLPAHETGKSVPGHVAATPEVACDTLGTNLVQHEPNSEQQQR